MPRRASKTSPFIRFHTYSAESHETVAASVLAESDMKDISDDYMRSMMQTTKTYTLLILRPIPTPRDSTR